MYLFVALATLPLFFGTAHHLTWYLALSVLTLLAGCFVWVGSSRVLASDHSSDDRTSHKERLDTPPAYAKLVRKERYALLLLVGITTLAAGYHLVVARSPHPLFGMTLESHSGLALLGVLSGVLFLIIPTLVFSIADCSLLKRSVILSGVGASVIALLHWGNDDGTFLWLFSPEHVFETDRARWPFVNPNHLAAFLLAPLGLAAHELIRHSLQLLLGGRIGPMPSSGARRSSQITTLLLPGFAVLFCAAALLATQSRAGWLAATTMLCLILLHEVALMKLPTRERIGIGGALVVVAFAAVWGLLTSDRLASLTANRIDYATAYGSDDIRFKYWADASQLLTEQPLLGIGPGAFAHQIERVARPELAGLNPVYLHNDVYQFLLEYGLFAFAAAAWLAWLLITPISLNFQAIFIGALITANFDFPFRIGAILIQWGIVLALARLTRIKASRP